MAVSNTKEKTTNRVRYFFHPFKSARSYRYSNLNVTHNQIVRRSKTYCSFTQSLEKQFNVFKKIWFLNRISKACIVDGWRCRPDVKHNETENWGEICSVVFFGRNLAPRKAHPF